MQNAFGLRPRAEPEVNKSDIPEWKADKMLISYIGEVF